VQMKCKDCGHRYAATKTQGGFWNKLSYSPKRCPECNSKNVGESSPILDAIGKFLGL
jgi:predicted Zn-ribbon and HTH transcriptional regulator